MRNERMKIRGTIGGKFLNALVLMALIICIITSILVTALYYNDSMEDYSASAFALGKMAADYIDGDRIQKYVDTLEKDEYYQKVQEFLDPIKKEFKMIWYYYVTVHDGDEMIYIWDAYNDENWSQLGDRELYMEGGRACTEAVLSKTPAEDFITSWHPEYGLIGTARVPIYNSQGEPVAVVGVDLNMPGVVRIMAVFLVTVIVSVLVVTALCALVFYRRMNNNILRPIRELERATSDLVQNIDQDRSLDVNIHTGDELEALANSFTDMEKGLHTYIHELSRVTAEKERIGAELNVATQIQADMLPRIFPAFPNRKDFDIYATMNPAKEVGGDFYDFFLVDEDHLGLVMADVSGKGVPAALFMVIAKTLIKNRIMMGESPSVALSKANNQLCEGNDAEMFVTVWAAVIELSTGKGIAVNAGHEHPAIRRGNGAYELAVYRHSPAVATMEGMRFREHEFQLNPGDSLFVYTDGVPEATDSHNELFGPERMLVALNSHVRAKGNELLPAVKQAIDSFVGDAPQFDDITMLNLQYYGPNGAENKENA